MFEVPRSAGGRPWILGSLTAVLAVAALGVAAVHHFRPDAAEARDLAAATAPIRPPLVEVEDLPRLRASLQAASERGFSGAVLVAKGDQVLFRQVYGLANYERAQPLALDSKFRLASVSKQFTAVAILKLQDQGVLSVDDPLCKWIQPCPDAWAPIRLSHLLAHTAGIPDLMARPQWGLRRVTPATSEELTEDSTKYRPQFPPGTKIRYSNAGYNLLGRVVEIASGKPFADYLRTEILDPLGLKDTGYDDGSADIAMGYALFPGGLTPQPNANPSIVFASGGLYSTLDDMLIWTRALHRGGLLSEASHAKMIEGHNPPDTPNERGRPPRAWGFGVFTNSLGERVEPAFHERQIYHTGSWSGFRNLATYQPDADVTVIVLSNQYHQRDTVFLISQQAMAEALGHDFPRSMKR